MTLITEHYFSVVSFPAQTSTHHHKKLTSLRPGVACAGVMYMYMHFSPLCIHFLLWKEDSLTSICCEGTLQRKVNPVTVCRVHQGRRRLTICRNTQTGVKDIKEDSVQFLHTFMGDNKSSEREKEENVKRS